MTNFTINGKTYQLEEAKTPEQQAKGLGGRASMPQNHGMLFIFSQPAVQCFWMKGMEFNLDIIWLSSSKQVLDITSNLSPSTYPKTVCPDVQAMYVVELNAGQAQQSGMTVGETAQF